MEEPDAMTRTSGSERGPCNCAWAYSIALGYADHVAMKRIRWESERCSEKCNERYNERCSEKCNEKCSERCSEKCNVGKGTQ